MKVSIGSVSHGTMREEDLIPAFTELLKSLDVDKYLQLIEDCENWMDYEPEEQSELLNGLFDVLNNFAPAYCYFGSHKGNGSDYGYWVDDDILDYFDGLKVSDLCEVPDNFNGKVLHINDHGNMTFYVFINGEKEEIWGIV
jgi:hypothetical protein